MNRYNLYKSFGEIDDELLQRSENSSVKTRKAAYARLVPMAACICLLLAVSILPWIFKDGTPGSVDQPAQNSDASPITGSPTSDTYSNLQELLSYLSLHDDHSDIRLEDATGADIPASANGKEPADSTAVVENTGVALDMSGEYSYHIGYNCVHISHLTESGAEHVGSIDTSAGAIFTCGERLFIISSRQAGSVDAGSDHSGPDLSVRTAIYDISDPVEPEFLGENIQAGELTGCWMWNGNLYLATSDGVCACGWSRLSDTEEYYPSLLRSGASIGWTDQDISILGEPTRIQYTAVTVVEGDTNRILEKHAFYGNILELSYGKDYIALTVAGETADWRENPVVYTFDGELNFTGKIDVAQALGVPGKNTLQDYIPQDGQYITISSISKSGDTYRFLGTLTALDGGSSTEYFMAATADTETGNIHADTLSADGYPRWIYTEIHWEDTRAIGCVGITSGNGSDAFKHETRFVFVDFSGLEPSFHESGITASYLDMSVGVSYGNPLGEFETLIPLGHGLYVRYSSPSEGPGGFDLFDFSESSNPKLIWRADASLSGDDAFEYVWHVYDNNTFGVLKILLGDEDFFRDVSLVWQVFSVGTDGTVTLESEIPIPGVIKTYLGADYQGALVFESGGCLWYAAENLQVPVYLGDV